jgi:hypothetical protein
VRILSIIPGVPPQEIVSPTGAHKYERTSVVTSRLNRSPVTGRAAIELVGDWL